VDVNKDGTLDNNDFRVKLSGVTSLTAADLGFGVGNTINLTAAGAKVDLTNKTNADNFSTVEDDIINTKTAFLDGSTIDAKGGTDVMNITDDLAGTDLAGVGLTVTSVEQVNLLQGASVASFMFNGPTKIVSSAATNLTLGTGGQTYVGSAAVDNITGGGGNDSINGGAGNDTIVGSAGNDTLLGGDGDDQFTFATGILTANTVIDGGAGANTLNVTGAGTATKDANLVNVQTVNWTPDDGTSARTLDLTGQTENFTINVAAYSNSGNNVANLTLGAGDDTIILANAGNFNTNEDIINGGGGTNTLRVDAGTLNAAADNDLVNIASITLNKSSGQTLTLTSQTENFTITGSSGNDSITGGGGNDSINGGNGNDTIVGNGGNDSINGGAGDDSISGSAGADRITLGAGNDTVALTTAENAPVAGYVITDFLQGTGTTDVIKLDMSGAAVVTATNIAGVTANRVVIIQNSLTLSQITADTTALAQANSFILVHNTTSGKAELWFDDNWQDGGNRTLVATFDNIVSLAGVTGFASDDFNLT